MPLEILHSSRLLWAGEAADEIYSTRQLPPCRPSRCLLWWLAASLTFLSLNAKCVNPNLGSKMTLAYGTLKGRLTQKWLWTHLLLKGSFIHRTLFLCLFALYADDIFLFLIVFCYCCFFVLLKWHNTHRCVLQRVCFFSFFYEWSHELVKASFINVKGSFTQGGI